MGTENATWISQFDVARPAGATEKVPALDDQIRMVKQVLKTQFPNLSTTAVTVSATQINKLAGITTVQDAALLGTAALLNTGTANGTVMLNGVLGYGGTVSPTLSDPDIQTQPSQHFTITGSAKMPGLGRYSVWHQRGDATGADQIARGAAGRGLWRRFYDGATWTAWYNFYNSVDTPSGATGLALFSAASAAAARTSLGLGTAATKNEGTGSGLNADLLRGLVGAIGAAANTYMQRDGSGDSNIRYLFSEYVNMSHGISGSTGDTIFYSSTDNYIRKNNAAGMRASLGVYSAAQVDSLGWEGVLATNGWLRHKPSGFTFQWGIYSGLVNAGGSVVFLRPMSAIYSADMGIGSYGGANGYMWRAVSRTPSGFSVGVDTFAPDYGVGNVGTAGWWATGAS